VKIRILYYLLKRTAAIVGLLALRDEGIESVTGNEYLLWTGQGLYMIIIMEGHISWSYMAMLTLGCPWMSI